MKRILSACVVCLLCLSVSPLFAAGNSRYSLASLKRVVALKLFELKNRSIVNAWKDAGGSVEMLKRVSTAPETKARVNELFKVWRIQRDIENRGYLSTGSFDALREIYSLASAN